MLEKSREQLAAAAHSLEALVMDLVTSRLQLMDIWSPSSVLELEQRLKQELQSFKEDLEQENGEKPL